MNTVFITGANRGLGLALVKAYLAKGDEVIATCRHLAGAESLQTLLNESKKFHVLSLDVTDEQSLAALVATLSGRPIDILINNAGTLSGAQPKQTVLEQDLSQKLGSIDVTGWEKIFRINTISPLMIMQALLPNLRASKTRKIAMISSGWGSITKTIEHNFMAYGSSKAALNYATKSVSFALQDENFVVVALNPGWVKTDMGSQGATLTPEESASRLIRVIDTLTPEQTGQFIRHTGELIPW